MNGPSPLILALSLFTVAVCGLAFWKGGRAERFGAAVILANQGLTFVLTYVVSGKEIGALAQLALDGVTAMALLFVVLRFGSPWLGAAMLLYAGQFGLHSFYLVTERPNDWLHAVANNIIFLGVSLSLVTGVALAWSKRARTQPKVRSTR